MTWRGIRITLGCGHMELRDRPEPCSEEEARWVIGSLAACYTCPLRKNREGEVWGQVALRQVVNVEEIMSTRRPQLIDAVDQHWEGGYKR